MKVKVKAHRRGRTYVKRYYRKQPRRRLRIVDFQLKSGNIRRVYYEPYKEGTILEGFAEPIKSEIIKRPKEIRRYRPSKYLFKEKEKPEDFRPAILAKKKEPKEEIIEIRAPGPEKEIIDELIKLSEERKKKKEEIMEKKNLPKPAIILPTEKDLRGTKRLAEEMLEFYEEQMLKDKRKKFKDNNI